MSDQVNHPAHYTAGPVEVIDIIEGFNLGFCLGNVIKYLLRADHKGAPITDLEKGAWYLQREIARRKAQAAKFLTKWVDASVALSGSAHVGNGVSE